MSVTTPAEVERVVLGDDVGVVVEIAANPSIV
jgi:hypothetical protein